MLHAWMKEVFIRHGLFLPNPPLQHQNESPMHPPSRSVKSRPICVTHEWMKIRSSHTCSADSRLSECLAQDSRLLSIFLNFESVTSAIVRVVLGVRVVRGVRVVHGVRVSSVLFAAFALFSAFASRPCCSRRSFCCGVRVSRAVRVVLCVPTNLALNVVWFRLC